MYTKNNGFTRISRWNKRNLTWYFPWANAPYREVAKKAFTLWEESSNLRFFAKEDTNVHLSLMDVE